MARKNRRVETYEPLDMTPPPPNPMIEARKVAEDERRRRIRLAEQQESARRNRAIDWSVCLVPGCGESLRAFGHAIHQTGLARDHRVVLPLCDMHLTVVAKQADRRQTDPYLTRLAAEVDAYLLVRAQEVRDEQRAAYLARQDGDIYFIRLGELVKVGWTRDLGKRLKSYGASAVLIVSYPATRDDETNLHRQLTPARAKGREWYHDGDLIQRFIDEALDLYGMPPSFDHLWTKPKQVVAGKRHR